MKTTVRGDKTEVIRLRVSKTMKERWEQFVIASGKDEGSLSAFIRRHIEGVVNPQPEPVPVARGIHAAKQHSISDVSSKRGARSV
jgi:hypothetical protein